MENTNNDFPIKALLILAAIYAIYEVVNAIVAAVFLFLTGLVYIALAVVGILAASFLYRYLSDKQYGETKRLQQIEKLERQRKHHTSRLPKHLKEDADQYYQEKQRALFDLRPGSRLDAALDRMKQVFSTFRRKDQ